MRHWAILVQASAAGEESTRVRPHSQLLWPLPMEESGLFFHKTLERLLLNEFGFPPHARRPVSASLDMLAGQRGLLSVKENFAAIFDNRPSLLERLEARALPSLPRTSVQETASWAQGLLHEPARAPV